MKVLRILVCIIGFLICLLSCSKQDVSGNGTLIGNPTVAAIKGTLYEVDGKTPARNAAVYLREKNALVDIGQMSLKKTIVDSVITTTDDQGVFSIQKVDPGLYMIECTDGNNNYALYDSVAVENPDSSIILPDDTLKPAGAVKGTINLSSGGNPEDVYVLVFGVLRFATVDSEGFFCLDDLAEGNYDLRIVSSDKNYGYLGTNISVTAGDTTNLGNVELPFVGTPEIRNLTIEIDTLKQIVNLYWDVIDTSLILGFNVYRSVNNGDYIKYNELPLVEPEIHDSVLFPNRSYSYRVSMVKKDSTESVKSGVVFAQNISIFSLLDTLYLDEYPKIAGKRHGPSCMIAADESFYVVDGKLIRQFDTSFNLIRTLSDTSLNNPLDLATGTDGRLYVADVYSEYIHKILVFDNNGMVIRKYNFVGSPDTTFSLGIGASLFSVDNKDRLILVSSRKDSIYICDTSGSIIRSWGRFGTGISDDCGITAIATDENGNIYAYEFERGIKVFDSNGVSIRVINTKDIMILYDGGHPNSLDVLKSPMSFIMGMSIEPQSGRIFAAHAGGFCVLESNGQLLTNYSRTIVPQQVIIIGNYIYAMDQSWTNKYVSRIFKMKNCYQ